MRKIICALLCIICCVMGACSNDKIFIEPEINPFSWSEDEEKYRTKDMGVWAIFEGFKNTSINLVNRKEDAIKLAKNEIEMKYDSIKVFYDKKDEMWMVMFYRTDVEGGDQYVYMDKNGLTKLIAYWE